MKRRSLVTRSGRQQSVCVLTRFPRHGEVKTRLVPPLSADEALDLHERLTRQAVRSALALAACGEASVEVRCDAEPRATRAWLGMKGVAYRQQGPGDLGARIAEAFAAAFAAGSRKALVIGSDCPRLDAGVMREALGLLGSADVVLGPAADGGYYLIGIASERAAGALDSLFSGVPWGGPEVLATTLDLVGKAGLRQALLGTLPDVDRGEDLADAEIALARSRVTPDAAVSVIVPALDDARLIGAAVASARAALAHEVIVVDGGSRDLTRQTAEAAGAQIVDSPPGRAVQMNAGAARASGEVLLFLHADTLLPAGGCRLAADALSSPAVSAGGFGFSVPDTARHSRLISAAGRWRARLGGLPWGDQALFMSRDVFRELGGFPEQPVMEDMELVHRLRRFGRVVTLPQRAITSARAWDEHGLLLPTAVNLAAIAAYRAGADPRRIAAWRSRIAAR